MPHSPERLAYWYFRLNGFLTTENFIVHPDEGKDQRTDADLLAVRFQHRAENVIPCEPPVARLAHGEQHLAAGSRIDAFLGNQETMCHKQPPLPRKLSAPIGPLAVGLHQN